MDLLDIPEEIAAAIYNQAYAQGFKDGQTSAPSSQQAMVAKRKRAYKSWLVRLGVERQMRAKQQRMIDPRMPHATVVPLFGK